jgi:hypothetical protein
MLRCALDRAKGECARMRLTIIALMALLVGSCAGAGGTEYCYKTVRSPTGKGPRALAVTACPTAQQSMSIEAPDAERATAG